MSIVITAKLDDDSVDQIAIKVASILQKSKDKKEVASDKDYTVKEAVPLLKLGEARIKQLLRDGVIKGKRPGSKWLISQSEINNYLNNE
ncbi:helix-turn-helix domain-containing protein [Flavobacterium mekongense]|uniref:helix-turn-helix domain-containing protein n=1 Tax=Flavobacterium mekongense TaxID=3379707 RepID=UPI00399AA541